MWILDFSEWRKKQLDYRTSAGLRQPKMGILLNRIFFVFFEFQIRLAHSGVFKLMSKIFPVEPLLSPLEQKSTGTVQFCAKSEVQNIYRGNFFFNRQFWLFREKLVAVAGFFFENFFVSEVDSRKFVGAFFGALYVKLSGKLLA